MSAVRSAPTPGTVADLLRRRLLTLDYPAFARCVCLLLEALGYENARPAGRDEWKGYNRPGGGGYDLEAELPGGLVPRRVIAQIKQYDCLAVHQRSVDELRGACLRTGAAEGVIITTSAFSQVVRSQNALPECGSGMTIPVRLIGGDELIELMVRHRIGVRERGRIGKRRLQMDEAFFQSLNGFRSLTGPAPALPSRHSRAARSGWQVTIQVFPSPRLWAGRGRPGEVFDRKGGD